MRKTILIKQSEEISQVNSSISVDRPRPEVLLTAAGNNIRHDVEEGIVGDTLVHKQADIMLKETPSEEVAATAAKTHLGKKSVRYSDRIGDVVNISQSKDIDYRSKVRTSVSKDSNR